MKKLIIFSLIALFFSSAAYSANYITAVSESQTLYGTKTSAKLWARISPPTGVTISNVWAEVDGDPITLTDDNNDGVYEAVYNNFNASPQSYMILFYTKDNKGIISEPDDNSVSSVTKTEPEADDYEPDDEFTKANPIILNSHIFQQHSFHKIGDTDWVKFYGISDIPYKINLNNLSNISNTVISIFAADGITKLKESLNNNDTAGKQILLEWDCPANGIYYVRFRNFTDSFGGSVKYEVRISQPTAPISGRIEGTVKDSVSRLPVGDVIITTTQKRSAITSSDTGYYDLENHPAESYMLTAKAEGYQPLSVSGTLAESGVVKHDISLIPSGSVIFQKGDLNKDKSVDLKDAILALRVLAGLEFSDAYNSQTDVNGDNRIGLEEVIYILQKIAGLR